MPDILYKGWVKGASKENCISGFRSTGIWPLNMNWVVDKAEILAPSLLFYKSASVAPEVDGADAEDD